MNVQVEISTTKCWMLLPSYLRAFRMRYQKDLIDFEDKEKVIAAKIMASSGEIISDENANVDENGEPRSKQRDKFVSLLYVDGPITRNGGACSYGSRDLRDLMMENANDEDCIGHIFYINTPGGSAWAANDFKQAIAYVREKKQPVIAYVDGMCCSAGMYLAALCDERYYMNPKNEIGCIGVMAAFYTEKDGEKNSFGETYHELYDPESFDKNKEMRDIANEGDAKLLLKELADLGVEFRADVKKACPNAGEEHLHGKVFNAEDVKGILMDGQKSLTEVFSRVVEIANERGLGNEGNNRNNYNNPIKNNVNMKENYPAVFALLGVEEMQMSEGGAFLNEGLLATLNAAIEAKNKEVADAKALADQLTAEKDNLTAQIETIKTENAQAVENLNAEHQKAIDDLNAKIADQEQDITAKEETIGNLQNDLNAKQTELDQKAGALAEKETELAGVQASLTTAEQTLAERDQQITDLNAQITELQNNAGQEPAAGAAPQNNGGGAESPELVVNRYVFDPNLSYEDNCKAEAKWNKEHGIEQ